MHRQFSLEGTFKSGLIKRKIILTGKYNNRKMERKIVGVPIPTALGREIRETSTTT
jgi:hypothetical protein